MSDISEIIDDLSKLSIQTPSADSDSNKTEISQISLLENSEKIKKLSKQLSQIFNSESCNNSNTLGNLSTVVEVNEMSLFKPEYLKCVPEFDGNPNDLNRYLSICESLINNFYNVSNPNDFQNTFLLNSLIGKLSGTAKVVVNIQNVSTWDDLKETLRRNFADQRDESCLNRDLVMLRQQANEQPSQFYDRILQILNLLCSYIDIHEVTNSAKILKKSLYSELALKTFLSGLKEPLGTTIRCMRPKNLAEALQFVVQENNTHYFQNLTRPIPRAQNHNPRAHQQPHFKMQQPSYSFPQSGPTFPNFNTQSPQHTFFPRPNFSRFPSQPINIRPNFNVPQRFPTNSMVFGKRNQTNVFRPNQNKILPTPQPMSVCSSLPAQKTPQQNPNAFRHQASTSQNPKFTFEELYNSEMEQPTDPDLLYQYPLNESYDGFENTSDDVSYNNHYGYHSNIADESCYTNQSSYPPVDNTTDLHDEGSNFQLTPQNSNPT